MGKTFLKGCLNPRVPVLLAAVVLCCSCLREPELKLPFDDFTPAESGDGWEISTPDAEAMDAEALRAIYRDVHADGALWQVRSLLTFRGGRLVAESYTQDPADAVRRAPVWSCTKQVVGILVGMAAERGLIDGVDGTLGDYLRETPADKSAITIENLLTMRSGIDFDNDGFGGESDRLLRGVPDSSVGFVLGLPTSGAAGGRFRYNDGDPQLLSAILQRRAGRTLDEWADEVLLSRIGLRNYDWVRYRDGVTMGAFGISTTPRDLARIGQLVLDRGVWRGERVVSAEWIDRMTAEHVAAEATAADGASFGYLWWIDAGRGVRFMWGQGGQFVVVKPEKGLMVVMTADPNVGAVVSWPAARDIFDSIDRITR